MAVETVVQAMVLHGNLALTKLLIGLVTAGECGNEQHRLVPLGSNLNKGDWTTWIGLVGV